MGQYRKGLGPQNQFERKRGAREAPTVGDGLRRFFDEFAPARIEMGRLSPRTISDYRWQAGRFLEPSLGKHFGEITAAAAGIEDVRLHDLRRTVMTRAAASGIGTHVLRNLLGHKTTAMADRYIRSVGDPVREAV